MKEMLVLGMSRAGRRWIQMHGRCRIGDAHMGHDKEDENVRRAAKDHLLAKSSLREGMGVTW